MASPISATMPLSRCWTTERVMGSAVPVICTWPSILSRSVMRRLDTPAPQVHQFAPRGSPIKRPFRALDLAVRQAGEIGRRRARRLDVDDGFGDCRKGRLEMLRRLDDDDVL